MNQTTNLYQQLGVSENASAEQLKSAYRKLAKQYHPDANKGDAVCEKRFREINEAYMILSDDEKRKAYDEEQKGKKTSGSSAQKTNRKTEHWEADTTQVDFEQIHKSFENFFGFHPESKDITNEKKLNPQEHNPLDTSKLFEQFMGIKR